MSIDTIVFASSNKGKIEELNSFFSQYNITVIPQSHFGVEDAIEDGLSFVENAIIKARHLMPYTDLPVLSDDSGIIIDQLNGEPGIYSARYAGDECDFTKNIAKVITKLQEKQLEHSAARFFTVLAFMQKGINEQTPKLFEGVWEGEVICTPRGDYGFGYDPIFLDPMLGKTAAEVKSDESILSHRDKALMQFVKCLL